MCNPLSKFTCNGFFLPFFLCYTVGYAQTLNLKDFEKMSTIKTVKEYLLKKDFVVKQDSSNGENLKLKMVNKATKEIVHVSLMQGSEGDKSFTLDYFTEPQEEYAKIVRTIIKSGYNPQKDERHYEKRNGTYETYNLVLKGAVNVKGWDYFGIGYSYYAGKELSEPVAPSK